MNVARFLILFCLTVPSLMRAETIMLTAEDLHKLDIGFATAQAADSTSGSRLPGTVTHSPDASTAITSLYAGIVESWRVNSGASVQANQILATVRSQDFMDLQRQWLTNYADYEQSQFDMEKDALLFEQGIISAQQLKRTQREFAKAQAEFNSSDSSLRMLGVSDKEFVELREGRGRLGIYPVRTPVAGMLTHRAYQAGEYFEANSVVANVQLPDALWVRIQVPAHLAAQIIPGQAVAIENSNETLTVRLKDFEVDALTQSIEVYAEFDQSTGRLPGQILSVMVAPAVGGVLLPSSAVVHTGEETLVYVKSSDGIEARAVSLLAAGDNYIAVSGIDVGEQVVVRGAAILKGIQLGLGGGE